MILVIDTSDLKGYTNLKNTGPGGKPNRQNPGE